MLRYIFAAIVLLHGLIHLMGFTKAYHYAEISQTTGNLSRSVGLVWLCSALLFLVVASLLLLKRDSWWIVAILAIILSQMLIIGQWKDASYGTIANILILLPAIASYGSWSFNKKVNKEIQSLLSSSASSDKIVTAEMLDSLPSTVKNWLQNAGVVGKEMTRTVYLKQKGVFRTKSGQQGMPVDATQYFTTDQPGFIWKVNTTMASLIPVSGRDKYDHGKGSMLIKLFSLIPVANEKGDKMDQGAMLRYLGEMVWFPTAALSPYLKWTAVDPNTAKVTMSYEGITASAVFQFDESGNCISFSADRYMSRGKTATLEKWYVPIKEWKWMKGYKIPVKGDVIWKLASGDFDYYEWEITAIEYNILNRK